MDNTLHFYYSAFSYFLEQLEESPDWWKDKRILDFGGNWGNILRDPKCTISHKNYSCLDVSERAIEEGKKTFPEANWYHYNRWNFMYNYKGNLNEPIPLIGKFDVILSYSVLTIGKVEEMVSTIREDLLPRLNSNGILMNTYLSMSEEWPLRWFLKKRGNTDEEIKELLDIARTKDFVYFVGKNTLTNNDKDLHFLPQSTLLTFYKDEKIRELFPECEIKTVVLRNESHCQKCMIFRK